MGTDDYGEDTTHDVENISVSSGTDPEELGDDYVSASATINDHPHLRNSSPRIGTLVALALFAYVVAGVLAVAKFPNHQVTAFSIFGSGILLLAGARSLLSKYLEWRHDES